MALYFVLLFYVAELLTLSSYLLEMCFRVSLTTLQFHVEGVF